MSEALYPAETTNIKYILQLVRDLQYQLSAVQRFAIKHTNFCTDDLGWGGVLSSVSVLTDKLYDFVLRSYREERETVKDQLK